MELKNKLYWLFCIYETINMYLNIGCGKIKDKYAG